MKKSRAARFLEEVDAMGADQQGLDLGSPAGAAADRPMDQVDMPIDPDKDIQGMTEMLDSPDKMGQACDGMAGMCDKMLGMGEAEGDDPEAEGGMYKPGDEEDKQALMDGQAALSEAKMHFAKAKKY